MPYLRIAESLAILTPENLVQTEDDPADRPKSLVSLTAARREIIHSVLASRDVWPVHGIDAATAHEERPDLDRAIHLLERLGAVRLIRMSTPADR